MYFSLVSVAGLALVLVKGREAGLQGSNPLLECEPRDPAELQLGTFSFIGVYDAGGSGCGLGGDLAAEELGDDAYDEGGFGCCLKGDDAGGFGGGASLLLKLGVGVGVPSEAFGPFVVPNVNDDLLLLGAWMKRLGYA